MKNPTRTRTTKTTTTTQVIPRSLAFGCRQQYTYGSTLRSNVIFSTFEAFVQAGHIENL